MNFFLALSAGVCVFTEPTLHDFNEGVLYGVAFYSFSDRIIVSIFLLAIFITFYVVSLTSDTQLYSQQIENEA